MNGPVRLAEYEERRVLLDEEDARWLGGSPREWLAAGPAAVVVTRPF